MAVVNKEVGYSLLEVRKQNFHLFLIWSRVSGHGTHHLGPIWSDPTSSGVLPGQVPSLTIWVISTFLVIMDAIDVVFEYRGGLVG